jgi:hypothetical protein
MRLVGTWSQHLTTALPVVAMVTYHVDLGLAVAEDPKLNMRSPGPKYLGGLVSVTGGGF